jgi:hypothetical protein
MGSQPRKGDVDITPAGAPIHSSALAAQAEAVPAVSTTLDEPPAQGAQIMMPTQAKASESQIVSKMDAEKSPGEWRWWGKGTYLPIPGFGRFRRVRLDTHTRTRA